MQRKIAVMLIFLLLNCYINVFAEIYQRDDIGGLSYTDLEYTTATDAQAKKTKNIAEKNSKEAEIRIEDEIINLSFPANIHAYFDPENLSGKGQVFSDTYIIKNYGNTDLSIKIKNIDVNYWSDEYTYEFTEEKVTATPSQIKKINVDMIWENKREREKKILKILDSEPNQIVLNLKAAKYNEDGEFIELNDSSIGSFYFTGTLNSNPNLVWEDGEITLNFDYEIVSDRNEESVDEFLEEQLNIKRDNIDNISEKIETTFDNEEQETEKNNKKNKEILDNSIEEENGKFSQDSIQKAEDLEINQDENKDDDRQESNIITENETDKEIKEKDLEMKGENEEVTEDKEIIEDEEIIKDKEITDEKIISEEKEQEMKEENEKITEENGETLKDREQIEDKGITDKQEISEDDKKIEGTEELEENQKSKAEEKIE